MQAERLHEKARAARRSNLEEGEAPLEELRMKLEEQLDKRMAVEDELKLARLALEDADRELRDAEKAPHPGRTASAVDCVASWNSSAWTGSP